MTWRWLLGLVRRRPGSIIGAAAGIAIAVALVAGLGGFVVTSQATMTQRAATSVAVDWQVQVAPTAHPSAVLKAIRDQPRTTAALPVGFATSPGLAARAGGTVQATGSARILGIPASYPTTFPGAIRLLVGRADGPLLAQQTAANLHAAPGDTITVRRPGTSAFTVRVAGVVELPQADSLFQRIGVTTQGQPIAPPDNVVLLPSAQFDHAYRTLQRTRPDVVTSQIHAARDHNALPSTPADAYVAETGAANNLEAVTAGGATVGNNLGAALGAAREDAAYAQILFLFLAVPGVILAAGLTGAVAGAAAERRRREQVLLRARGATTPRLMTLAVLEAVLAGVLGSVMGLAAAWSTGAVVTLRWDLGAALVGIGIAALVVAGPAIRDTRAVSAPGAGSAARRDHTRPFWLRLGLDVVLIAIGLAIFKASGQNKYTLVLAPEGAPTVSASYWAFLGPTLAWLGLGMLCWRIAEGLLARFSRPLAVVMRPFLGSLAPIVSSILMRRRRAVARATILLALALAYAVSTATFNSTYQQQAEVDAQLTNGADVTVTASPGATMPADYLSSLARIHGVRNVVPMLHRFAYVGNDLQDIYGIDTTTIGSATTLTDTYFQGITAAQAMTALATHDDGVLVSAETVNDYQLSQGDLIKLRVQDARTGQYRTVPFHYVGVVNEFPTAPKDSFIVANSAYLAQATHSSAVGTYLINTGGSNIDTVAQSVRTLSGVNGTVGTLLDAQNLVGSSLTSVDLGHLSRLELVFAALIAAAAGGLVLGLGLAERRRTIALTTALGATARQTRRLEAVEPGYVLLVGSICGLLSGWAIAALTVKVLTGVFDPPPSHLAAPWTYLLLVVAATVVSVVAVGGAVTERARRSARQLLRDL